VLFCSPVGFSVEPEIIITTTFNAYRFVAYLFSGFIFFLFCSPVGFFVEPEIIITTTFVKNAYMPTCLHPKYGNLEFRNET